MAVAPRKRDVDNYRKTFCRDHGTSATRVVKAML